MNSQRKTKVQSMPQKRMRANQIIKRLVGLADAQLPEQKMLATRAILDEYYRPEEFPTSDTMTEMMGWEHPTCKIVIIGTLAALAGLFLYCRR